jgi:hypothetical protein
MLYLKEQPQVVDVEALLDLPQKSVDKFVGKLRPDTPSP